MTENEQKLTNLIIEAHKTTPNPYPGDIARHLNKSGVVAAPDPGLLIEFKEVWDAMDEAKQALRALAKAVNKTWYSR